MKIIACVDCQIFGNQQKKKEKKEVKRTVV